MFLKILSIFCHLVLILVFLFTVDSSVSPAFSQQRERFPCCIFNL